MRFDATFISGGERESEDVAGSESNCQEAIPYVYFKQYLSTSTKVCHTKRGRYSVRA